MPYLCFAIVCAVLITLVLTPFYSYLSRHKKFLVLGTLVKGMTTAISLVFAIIGYHRLNRQEMAIPFDRSHAIWLLIGLTLCLLADIMLNYSFTAGGILFFLGHTSYLVFFLLVGGFHPSSIFIFTILAAITLCFFYRYSPNLNELLIPAILYGILILFSTSVGILLPFGIGVNGLPCAIAIVLLATGDFLLVQNKITEKAPVSKTLELLYYFTGQFIMAMTLYLPSIL